MKNMIIIGAIAVLLLAVVGLAAAVFASQSSLPGAPLYAFKLSTESMRSRLTQDSASQLELKFEFANRRFDEIYKLAGSKRLPPPSVVTQLQNNLDQCLYLAASGNEAVQKVTLERLRDRLQVQHQGLLLLQSQADPQLSETLVKVLDILSTRVQLAEMGLNDPQTFRQQLGGQPPLPGSPSSDDVADLGQQDTETLSPSETPTPGDDPALTETASAGSPTPETSGTPTPPGGISETPPPGTSETPGGSVTPPGGDDYPPGVTPGTTVTPGGTPPDDDQPPGVGPVITATPGSGGPPGGDDDLPPGIGPVVTATPGGDGPPPGDDNNPPGT